jgi:PAS domain S-box-containing protein
VFNASRRGSSPSTALLSSSTAPLSSRERNVLRRTLGSRLPLTFVLISLTLSVVLPRLTVHRILRLRNEISAEAEPARLRITQIQLDLALEAVQRRGFLLTGNKPIAREESVSRAHRLTAEQQLLQHVRELDGPAASQGTRSVMRLQALDRDLDSLVSTSPAATAAELDEQRKRFVGIQSLSDSVRTFVDAAVTSRRRAIDRTANDVALLTVALVLLGLAAALLVERLGSRVRALALRLEESESRFRQIAENLSAVVWLSDPEFRHTLYVNSAFERIWGRPRQVLESDPDAFLEGVHPDDREHLKSALVAMAHDVAEVEFRVVRPSGEIRWVWNRGFPVRDSTGRVFRVCGIAEDVTERREYALERERLLEAEHAAREIAEHREVELERVTESRGRLVRGFTHDVKNPLGAADGYLALLEEGSLGDLEDSQRDTLIKVRRSIGQALELIRGLLDVARAEAGELVIRNHRTDIVEVVRDVADGFFAQAKMKDVTLVAELPPHTAVIETDPALVRQVIGNLVSNAVKYTPSGGKVVLAVDTHCDPNDAEREQLLVTVSDNGPGIPADKLPMLFVEFTRLDSAVAEGAGIGLSISQKLAHALGGEITVESNVGVGTKFALSLPGPVCHSDATGAAA